MAGKPPATAARRRVKMHPKNNFRVGAPMHYVFARINVKPEVVDLAKNILLDLVIKSRQETGCMAYELYQQAEAPHVFQTVEQWKHEADAEAHMQTVHVGAAIAAAGPLLAQAPEIVAYSRLM